MTAQKLFHQLLTLSLLACFCTGLAAASRLPIIEGVGGDFSAASTLGHEISLSDYHGKVVLLSFGYTACSDVCPITFGRYNQIMQALGERAGDVQVLFVTVDPKTDTVEQLRKYMATYDKRYVGLTGSEAKIQRILDLFQADFQFKSEARVTTRHHRFETAADDAHLFSHSQQIYLLDKQGRIRALLNVGSAISAVRQDIFNLLAE